MGEGKESMGASRVPNASGRTFNKVTAEFNPSGGARREPAKIQVEPTGNAKSNTELTEFIMKNLSKFSGVTRENMKSSFGADEETGDIALYLAARGAYLHKIRDWGAVLGFHLGSVFRQYPGLRPGTTIECDVELDADAEGKACFVFNVYQGLAKKAEPVPGGRPQPEPKIRRKKKAEPQATGQAQPAPEVKPAPEAKSAPESKPSANTTPAANPGDAAATDNT